ncbi:MAG: hypothetical protein FJX71_05005 [Alphaproteobacteria bacterium]|nr:hypothetical protein [Alphaproteobacteria bacterium]
MNKSISTILFFITFVISGVQGIQGERERTEHVTPRYSDFQAASSFVRDAVSSIFTPDEHPTWQRAFTKAGAGILIFLTADNITPESGIQSRVLTVGQWVGTGLMINALFDIIYLLYDHVRSPSVARQAFGPSLRPSPQRQEAYNQIIEQRNHEMARVTRAGRFVLYSALTAYFISGYYQGLMGMLERGTNPFSFSLPKGTTCHNSWDFLCWPIMTPTFLTYFVATLAYNVRELSYFGHPDFPQRGYVPLFEMANGYALIGLSAQLARGLGFDPKTLRALEHISPELYDFYITQKNFRLGDRVLYRMLLEWGNLRVYTGKFLILKNFLSYPWRRVVIQKISIPHTEDSALPDIRPRRSRTQTLHPTAPQTGTMISTSTAFSSTQTSQTTPTATETSVAPHERIKTRGVADLTRAQRQHSLLPASPSLLGRVDHKQKERTEALQRLSALRAQYPIKTHLIDSELKKAAAFLGGQITPVRGSEFSLMWRMGDHQFAITFETPHGSDSSNYSGNKRDRVLNMLETCYLVGLNEDEVHKYIQANNLYHLLRFDKLVYFIFFSRNKETL